MAFKFYPLKRWRKQGFSSLLNIVLGIAVLYLSASMQDTVSTIIVIISSFLFVKGLYNSIYRS
ncbi:hypothetical protein KO561_07360 [Radiobacillus kanasensis]|uniref:hypothetical protein n=1 Tax=Radiobacillus kanasensis TaxID=2844358 RepID=UPI001E5AE688|nr:hypothetical protein [Radiobacillus kanasensis]UFU00744.1 hypothetical protein KO561_07360 [Radiobacillus kanasensis]